MTSELTYISISKSEALEASLFLRLKEFDQQFFPQSWSENAWGTYFYEGKEFHLGVLYLGPELVGFSLYDVNGADSFAHLFKILVHPEKRGLKLGLKLFESDLEVLKTKGINNFYLEVEEDNQSAIGLYQKLGFKIAHRKKHFYSNGKTALIMTL